MYVRGWWLAVHMYVHMYVATAGAAVAAACAGRSRRSVAERRKFRGVVEPAPGRAGTGRRCGRPMQAADGRKRVWGLRTSPETVFLRNWWRGLVSPPTPVDLP